MKIEINKSSRHSKITGNFAENLVLYFLSKHGFECANIDHVGIDIIARNPTSSEIMGISVKSRSRNAGKEGTYLRIPHDNFEKIDMACAAFKCVPYFAIVIDEENSIKIFILTKKHYLKIIPAGKSGWMMSKKWLEKYKTDASIMKIQLDYDTLRWWCK